MICVTPACTIWCIKWWISGWSSRLSTSSSTMITFLRATACNAIARLCYGRGVLPSVCPSAWPSVTLLSCVKTTQPRIVKSWLCDSLELLVSNEVILVPLGEEIPLERGHQRVVPHLEIVILPLLAHLAWKRLQVRYARCVLTRRSIHLIRTLFPNHAKTSPHTL